MLALSGLSTLPHTINKSNQFVRKSRMQFLTKLPAVDVKRKPLLSQIYVLIVTAAVFWRRQTRTAMGCYRTCVRSTSCVICMACDLRDARSACRAKIQNSDDGTNDKRSLPTFLRGFPRGVAPKLRSVDIVLARVTRKVCRTTRRNKLVLIVTPHVAILRYPRKVLRSCYTRACYPHVNQA